MGNSYLGLGYTVTSASVTAGTEMWPILIRDDTVTIGCQRFTIGLLWKLTDKEIDALHPRALYWWKKIKDPLRGLLIAMGKSDPTVETGWEDDWF